ncbi:hypothetical protein [Fimbriiglobus ruber]|uniref:Uncharacterized protein n=1 Tax=Fimbriiglobus ruber TaxID=1908690 RepID=A0A225E4U5_9BACT|nr:hypothetical protein [Fimbriiglobus ruber]OWK45818.1 hypothetical protein FRUB_02149 [Fimbriiglobus ruber]
MADVEIRCDDVKPGMRNSERIAVFSDHTGKKHYIRVEADFLSTIGGVHYLPVGLVQIDRDSGYRLVELPHEAETGANRLWIKPENIRTVESVMS